MNIEVNAEQAPLIPRLPPTTSHMTSNTVRVIIEGNVGTGKTAILAMIHKLLQEHVDVVIEDEYTINELKLLPESEIENTLKMYSPTVVLCEKIVSHF